MRNGGPWFFALWSFAIAACGPVPAPTTTCTPNQQVSCACAGTSETGTQVCDADGTGYGPCTGCPNSCVPNCNGASCGDDGCGGSCGTCGANAACQNSACVPVGCSPACARGFLCNNGACELDPGHVWNVVAVDGTVSERDCAGSSWDSLGGLPDPKFCLTLGGVRYCTESVADTLSPQWTRNQFPDTTPAVLLSGVPDAYLDEDVSSDDPICNGTFAFTTQNFIDGSATLQCVCQNGSTLGYVNMALVAQ